MVAIAIIGILLVLVIAILIDIEDHGRFGRNTEMAAPPAPAPVCFKCGQPVGLRADGLCDCCGGAEDAANEEAWETFFVSQMAPMEGTAEETEDSREKYVSRGARARGYENPTQRHTGRNRARMERDRARQVARRIKAEVQGC